MGKSIRNDIEIAITDNCHVYEIEYQSSSGAVKCWHISNIEYSKEYGDSHILAYVNEKRQELNFRIDRILKFDRYWVDILDETAVVPSDGLYVFACRGDNHIYTEMYMMKQGELLYKYFNDEYAHTDGWFAVIPLAYHIIDIDAIEQNKRWDKSTENMLIQYWFLRKNIVVAIRVNEEGYDYRNDVPAFSAMSDTHRFYFIEELESDMASGRIIPTGFVGFYTIVCYSEINHLMHWTTKYSKECTKS